MIQALGICDAGQIAIGGIHSYVELMNSAITFDRMIATTNALVMGVAFRPSTLDLFSVSEVSQTGANRYHDVDWIPDDSGLLTAFVPSAGILKLRRYDFDGTTLTGEWTPDIIEGWGQQHTKISVACDARTVFYTQQLHKIKRFDIVSGTQLPDYELLTGTDASRYIYGGIRCLPIGSGDTQQIIVAMTVTGDGPRRALCLDSDGINHWVDEINPATVYHIQKRMNATGVFVDDFITQYDTNPTHNDKTYSLACCYNPCGVVSRLPIMVTLIS